jgi:hypothetical protein
MDFPFDKEFDFNSKLIPTKGDFSFIIDDFCRKSLRYDYKFIKEYNLWNVFSFYKDLKENDPFKIFFKNNLYSLHTNETFETNMMYISFIYFNGWTEFVIKILNQNV